MAGAEVYFLWVGVMAEAMKMFTASISGTVKQCLGQFKVTMQQ